jgi:hypothetical protein
MGALNCDSCSSAVISKRCWNMPSLNCDVSAVYCCCLPNINCGCTELRSRGWLCAVGFPFWLFCRNFGEMTKHLCLGGLTELKLR